MNANVKNMHLHTRRHPGIFVTFEGGEGTGKSSQIKYLGEKLKKSGFDVVLTREPGGSPGAEAVRHVLLSGAAESFGSDMEAILFSAARSDHVDHVIRPALVEGKAVISDRFFDSTRVYQGVSGKAEPGLLRRLERIACDDVWPDITLILDLDPEEGMKRAAKRRSASEIPDRFEKEDIELQRKRREAFQKLADEEPDRCKLVDASGSEEEVAARVWDEVSSFLENMKGEVSSIAQESSRKTSDSKSATRKSPARKSRSGKVQPRKSTSRKKTPAKKKAE